MTPDIDDIRITTQPRTRLSQPLKMATLNVRGLGNLAQRRNLFRHLRSMNFDLICLQELQVSANNPNFDQWTREWNAPAPWTIHLGILLSPRLSFVDTSDDYEGRTLFATVRLASHDIRIANIYAPAKLHLRRPFFDNLTLDSLRFVSTDFLIGDWNAFPDPETDRISDKPHNPQKTSWNRLSPILTQHLDAAQLGSSATYYTFTSASHNTRTRIDHIFASCQYSEHSFNTSCHPYSHTDHTLLSLTISPPSYSRPLLP